MPGSLPSLKKPKPSKKGNPFQPQTSLYHFEKPSFKPFLKFPLEIPCKLSFMLTTKFFSFSLFKLSFSSTKLS